MIYTATPLFWMIRSCRIGLKPAAVLLSATRAPGSRLWYIDRTWPGGFKVKKLAAVLKAGLFGEVPPYTRAPERLGDRVIFPPWKAFFRWADKANPLLGRHGGLNPQEMLVPLGAGKLSW